MLYDDAMVARLQRGAESTIDHWGLSRETTVDLLAISENATFLAIDNASGRKVALRVHRPGYHTIAEIASELSWITELRRHGVVDTPEPLAGPDGCQIAGFDMDGDYRPVVAFTFMSGREPSLDDDLENGFRQLGALSARLHAHSRTWTPPQSFVRKVWNFETTIGPAPHWGDWRAATGLTADGARLLEKTCTVLHDRLAAYGTTADRFGLIHADLRLANLLIDGDRLGVIDFDDCGFGWFAYDFAAAVSFFEHDPVIPALQAAWVSGYRSVAPLSTEDELMLPTFVMLRRLLLTAWVASHPETPAAQDVGPGYTDGTLAVAEHFLTVFQDY